MGVVAVVSHTPLTHQPLTRDIDATLGCPSAGTPEEVHWCGDMEGGLCRYGIKSHMQTRCEHFCRRLGMYCAYRMAGSQGCEEHAGNLGSAACEEYFEEGACVCAARGPNWY